MLVNAYLDGVEVDRIAAVDYPGDVFAVRETFLPSLHEINGQARVWFTDGNTCVIEIQRKKVERLGVENWSAPGFFTFEDFGRFLYAVAEYVADEICEVYPGAKRRAFELPYRLWRGRTDDLGEGATWGRLPDEWSLP